MLYILSLFLYGPYLLHRTLHAYLMT